MIRDVLAGGPARARRDDPRREFDEPDSSDEESSTDDEAPLVARDPAEDAGPSRKMGRRTC